MDNDTKPKLIISYKDSKGEERTRCVANKWTFTDKFMGEQSITLTVSSEEPIDWHVGDYCTFRGEVYTLNYIPSATQQARMRRYGEAFVYESVKLESASEELTRCQMLDITPTTGDYVAAVGTNHTGSSNFQLFCGETSAVISGTRKTLTPVCALATKMQANLDRMYGAGKWRVLVDITSTYTDAGGNAVLVTHTDDKLLSYDNKYVSDALSDVHEVFDLDYCVKGRTIYIGYAMKNLISDNDEEVFYFGYGKGYPTPTDQGKALFMIKRIANAQQRVVTRLRVLGSTKNMPYRYYNKAYAATSPDLSQTLFPVNLQLPGTFLPEGMKTDVGGNTKWGQNNQRSEWLRKVKGDTNDAYIDKNDDAENCVEGVREASIRYDGSDSNLPEIYPTIEEATFGDLRDALVQDQDGVSGKNAFQPSYHPDSERIDALQRIGYMDGGSLVDDANKGTGILPESGVSSLGPSCKANVGQTNLEYSVQGSHSFSYRGNYLAGPDVELCVWKGVVKGKYAIAPTAGSVFFRFSGISCFRDGCSATLGYIMTVKQRSVNSAGIVTVTTLATYTKEQKGITRASGWTEFELPELPDVKDGDKAQVKNLLNVSGLSDLVVTLTPMMKDVKVPDGFTDHFGWVYEVGNSKKENAATGDPEYTLINKDEANAVGETFHVFLKDMGFDISACFTSETPVLAMKSGRCVGREFEIQKNVQKTTIAGVKGYLVTLKRAEDSNLSTYYPSATDPIAAGDHFVLLNISMPSIYVQMAEARLLRAATQWLSDNCDTAFTYQPYIDDLYLQRNYDKMLAAKTPEKSIFWRLYAGLRFTFRGIPVSKDEKDPLPLSDIAIEQVTIKMGDSLIPQVELVLNDDVQQSTLQKLTTSVDRIYNGSLFASGAGGGGVGANAAALYTILQTEGEKLFLSRTHDDVAEGKITFNDTLTAKGDLKAKQGVQIGNFRSRLLGSGALIDSEGNAEFESIYSRNFISTPEFRFNRIAVTDGEQWCTNGYGTIMKVTPINNTTGYIDLKLEENDYPSIEVGDICRGIYNDVAHNYETKDLDDDSVLYGTAAVDDGSSGSDGDTGGDSEGEQEGVKPREGEGFGFSCRSGFFTSYFWVKTMVTKKRGECRFIYELRNSSTPHPCEFMRFAQYGSFTNVQRRSSSYATSIGHYYEMVLDGVDTWKIKSANVVFRKGYLGDMVVQLKDGEEKQLQGYGMYCQDNVYFGNAVINISPETIDDIKSELANYVVEFSEHVDVITVDDVGNVIGGLYTLSGENNEYKTWRIHSAITVRNNNNILIVAESDKDAGAGTYKVYAEPHGCTCKIEDSTIYITGIDHIKDGVVGSDDDGAFDYAAMRGMEQCYVDLVIDCEGKGSIMKQFPIRIKHDAEPFVAADISNEFSAVSWNTQRGKYIGLPIEFDMVMWHNNEFLDVDSVAVAQQHTGLTVEHAIVQDAKNGAKKAHIVISALPEDLPMVSELQVTSRAVYAGVPYERTLTHTINKSTDTNVYWLAPSVPTVSAVHDEDQSVKVSTDKVYCSVRCDSSDDKHYTVSVSDYGKLKLRLRYQTVTLDTDLNEVTSAESDYNAATGVAVSTAMKKIIFKLYKMQVTRAEFDAMDVVETLDTEDVPILLDGLDGGNAIQVVLDNANDTCLALEDGTLIRSTLPTCNARLLDGETSVGSSVLGTDPTKAWSLICRGCVAEIDSWVTDDDGYQWVHIVTKDVTEDVAEVEVCCAYRSRGVGGTYTNILSIKKLYGTDKYEIVVNPKTVSYNPNTDSYTANQIGVNIYKTTQDEERHVMSSLPHEGEAVNHAMRLLYTTNFGVTNKQGEDITVWNLLKYGNTIPKGVYDVDGVENVHIKLEEYITGESGGEWVFRDQESVDIVGDGENVIRLGLDNENDSCLALEDGTVIASTLPVANAYLWDGNDMVNRKVADSTWQQLSCIGCDAEWVSGLQADGGKQFRVTAVTEQSASVTVRASYKDKIYHVIHNIKKLTGTDKYEIVTNPVSVAYNPNSNTYTPESFMVYIYKTTQQEARHLMTALPHEGKAESGALRLLYSVNKGTTWKDMPSSYSSGVSVGKSVFDVDGIESVELRIEEYITGESGGEWVLRDQESVDIVGDGSTPIVCDLRNEHTGVSWSTLRKEWIGLPATTELRLWDGESRLLPFTAIAAVVQQQTEQATVSDELVDGVVWKKHLWGTLAGVAGATWGMEAFVRLATGEFKVTRLDRAVPREVVISLTGSVSRGGESHSRSADFSLTCEEDTNVYDLKPSVTEVELSYDSIGQAVLSVSEVSCGVSCSSSDGGTYDLTAAQMAERGLVVKYQVWKGGVAVAQQQTEPGNVAVSIDRDTEKVTFMLYEGGVATSETEDVPVVKHGESNVSLYLDNQSDEVIADEDGHVVVSTLPETHAWLHVGGVNVPKSVLFDEGASVPSGADVASGQWLALECSNGVTAAYGETLTGGGDGYTAEEGKTVKVTGMTCDVGTVTIACRYTVNGVTKIHRAILTVKKQKDKDKYEIQTNPVSVVYDPNSQTLTPESVDILVYKTSLDPSQDGIKTVRELLSTLPGDPTEPVEGTLRLSLYYQGDWVRLSGMTIGPHVLALYRNSTLRLRLEKYMLTSDGTLGWVQRDEEGVEVLREGADGKGLEYIFFRQNVEEPKPTIHDDSSTEGFQTDNYCPYTDATHFGDEDYHWTDEPQGVGANQKFEFYAMRKKVNGVWQPFGSVKIWNRYTVDGESPYIIDLSNEQSLVNCEQNGSPLAGFTYPASEVMVLHGARDVRDEFLIKVVPTGISCNGYYPTGGDAVSGQLECPSGGFVLQSPYVLYPSVITQDAATIAITATKGSTVLVATYKLNKNKAGDTGVIYELMPSLNVIHKNKLGQFEDARLDVAVKKVVGSTPTVIDTVEGWVAEGLVLKYSQGDSSTQTELGQFANLDTQTLCGSGLSFTLYLYASGGETLLDKERLNVVVDGKDSQTYYLHPSRTSIDFHSDGDGAAYTPDSIDINCGYKEVKGDEETIYPGNVLSNLAMPSSNGMPKAGLTYTAPYNIFYRYENADGTKGGWGWMRNTPNTSNPTGILSIPNTTEYIGIEFALSNVSDNTAVQDDNIVARVTVPIRKVSDGDTGPQGEDANFHELRVMGANHGSGGACRLEVDGEQKAYSYSRGITAVLLNSDLSIYDWNSYDVYADYGNGNTYYTDQLLSFLRNYASEDKIVCLMSYDAIYIHDRLWAKLGCEYGVGKNIAMSQYERYGLAVICQKGMLPGQATVVMTDNGIVAEATGSVSNGVLIIQSTSQIPLGQNLLKQSNFEMVTAWAKHNGVVVENDCDGCNAYQCVATSNDYTNYLEQAVSGINSGPLKNETWYTLSFYGRGGGIRTYLYPLIIDTREKVYVDGVEAAAATDGLQEWTLGNMYGLHTFTFKTLPKCVYKGSYSSSLTYNKGDIVAVSGSTMTYYVSVANNNNDKDVSNTNYWRQITVDDTTTSSGYQSFAMAALVLWRKMSGTSTTYLAKLKLEEGIYCTAWQKNEHDRMGLTGCHERVFEVFTGGQVYYNEESDMKSGVRYVDFLAVEDNTMTSGYKVYMCNETHAAAATFNADRGYWSEVNVNAASAFFKYLIAKNANIKMLSSAQFSIVESDGSVVAGLANGSVPLFIGGTPASAPFRVTRAGKLYATGAEVNGVINAKMMYSAVKNINENPYTIDLVNDPACCFICYTGDSSGNIINLPDPSQYIGLELQFFAAYTTRSSYDVKIKGTLKSLKDGLYTIVSEVTLTFNQIVTVKAMTVGVGGYAWCVISNNVM